MKYLIIALAFIAGILADAAIKVITFFKKLFNL